MSIPQDILRKWYFLWQGRDIMHYLRRAVHDILSHFFPYHYITSFSQSYPTYKRFLPPYYHDKYTGMKVYLNHISSSNLVQQADDPPALPLSCCSSTRGAKRHFLGYTRSGQGLLSWFTASLHPPLHVNTFSLHLQLILLHL